MGRLVLHFKSQNVLRVSVTLSLAIDGYEIMFRDCFTFVVNKEVPVQTV